VEFLYGAESAIDSLRKEEHPINFKIFDSKAKYKTVDNLILEHELSDVDLIIAATNGPEVKKLADYALEKNILFINATYPNDAAVVANPNYLILNSTLRTHCEAIHYFLLSKLSEQRIVLLSKEGKQEDRVVSYFKDMEKKSTSNSLAIQYVNLKNDLSENNIEKYLDSSVLSTYVIGSTDTKLAAALTKVLSKYKLNEISNVVGLPTFDGAEFLENSALNDLHIYFTTPTHNPINSYAIKLGNDFKEYYGEAPGDNVVRGFEIIYKYTKLLIKHINNPNAIFTDTSFSNLMQFDIKPIILSDAGASPDYFENKKVYMNARYAGNNRILNL
jgi:hypothetical protein